MKAVVVYGSPRPHGSSATLAQEALQIWSDAGVAVSAHHLNQLTYRGCQGCLACKTTAEICVVNDGLTKVLAEVAQADFLLLTSPVYFHAITGQLKSFIDRAFSYLKPDFMTNAQPSRLNPGKKALFILTQGDPQPETFKEVLTKQNLFLKMFGYEQTLLVQACGLSRPEDLARAPQYAEQVRRAAQSLMA